MVSCRYESKILRSTGSRKPLEYYEFERREPLDNEVEVQIQFCGICHSDIHTARGDWGEIKYPCVTGHEIGSLSA